MANKFLLVGDGMKPGLYSQADSLSERTQKIKAMIGFHTRSLRTTLEQARDIGRELAAAKEKCISDQKPWLTWLATTGLSETKGRRYMRVAEYWTTLVEHQSFTTGIGLTEALIIIGNPEPEGADETTLPAPAKNGPPKASKPKSTKPTREKEEPLDRAKRVISEQIDQAETFHLVDEQETARLKNELHSIVSRAWKLFNAPKRAAMKPVHKKCWRCSAEIVIAQSAKSGKPLAYEKGKGRYIFDPDGRMEHTKFGGEYFPHHVRCPGVKK